ncbi:hypothetical protein [Streptomyces sp. NPDC058964]|uniref:hypothetical protein n=1 Tax=Streptomyces sp. NPDC058964 TaxID=3346681 RepID=UPI0036C84071
MLRTKVLAVWAAVPVAVVVAVAGPARAGGTPEADLEYHGSAVMSGDRMDVRLVPGNHGPSAVDEASVQLRWSVPLADRQSLPDGCVRTGERVVVCGTGALPADGLGKPIDLGVVLKDGAPEVTLEIDTAWSDGTVDANRSNDQARVLVLDTGDAYVF